MDFERPDGDAFAIPDFWQMSSLAPPDADPESLFFSSLDIGGRVDDLNFAPKLFEGLKIDLPAIGTLEDGIPSMLEKLDDTDDSSSRDLGSHEDHDVSLDEPEDIWGGGSSLFAERTLPKYYSWEAFSSDGFQEPETPYLMQAGRDVFDAALVLQARSEPSTSSARNSSAGNMIRSDVFIKSLFSLGLGRSSLLFPFDHEEGCFKPAIEDMRISGYTVDTIQSLITLLWGCGQRTRQLGDFVENTYKSRQSSRTVVALADSVSTLLAALQIKLSISPSSIRSLLHLQALFYHPALIIECMNTIVQAVSRSKTDPELLTRLYQTVQQLEYRSSWLREVLLEILARVSKPWLEVVAAWTGLQKTSGLLDGIPQEQSFYKLAKTDNDGDRSSTGETDYVFDRAMMPAFMNDQDAQVIFESGRSLRVLERHHPQHPLAQSHVALGIDPPDLGWTFSWSDIERVEQQAKDYENNLLKAIKRYTRGRSLLPASNGSEILSQSSTHEFETYGKEEQSIRAYITASAKALDSPVQFADHQLPRNKLRDIILSDSSSSDPTCLSSTTLTSTFAPPLSSAALLSFCPLLSARARVINSSTIYLFFRSHQLRSHLDLNHRFHLLGDGLFASRLAHALFDPDLETTERRRGVARTGTAMGLKLGARDSWPPASSELRLALMGVLTECYHRPTSTITTSSTIHDSTNSGHFRHRDDAQLPGGLSFAVRTDMSEDELKSCMNPDNLEALDFLRLQYKPPPPLEAVITPLALQKYDRLFRHLLRVTRMTWVVEQLSRWALARPARTRHSSGRRGKDNNRHRGGKGRDRGGGSREIPAATRLRLEAYHFISSLSSYFFGVGIGLPWARFQSQLDALERRIDASSDGDGSSSAQAEAEAEAKSFLSHTEGLHTLRLWHENVLDAMLFSLFLRRRQEPVLRLLEDIFGIVLQFARWDRARRQLRHRGGKDGHDDTDDAHVNVNVNVDDGEQRMQEEEEEAEVEAEEEVKKLYAAFVKRVGVFVTVIRGLSERRGYRERKADVDAQTALSGGGGGQEMEETENTIGYLLLRLEMGRYGGYGDGGAGSPGGT
ncbi:MAG: hypothetical protein M1819_007456 [Sarea resinae]|nr:MAG: hypothetical protein M1819_007456 [Sarea resinae]